MSNSGRSIFWPLTWSYSKLLEEIGSQRVQMGNFEVCPYPTGDQRIVGWLKWQLWIEQNFLKGLSYLEDLDFGGTKVIGSGKNQNMWNSVKLIDLNIFAYVTHGEGNGNTLQYSCLEYSMDREAWRATVHSITKSQAHLKWLSMHACIHVTHAKP